MQAGWLPVEAAQRRWRNFPKAPKGAACAASQLCYFAREGQPAFTFAKRLVVIPHRLRRDQNQFLEVPLGYCTAINFSILLLSSLLLAFVKDWAANFHARMFGISTKEALRLYVNYLAFYKALIILFNLVPFIVLCII